MAITQSDWEIRFDNIVLRILHTGTFVVRFRTYNLSFYKNTSHVDWKA